MDNLQLPTDPELAKSLLENQLRERQLGILGKIFGANPSTGTHMVGLVLVLLVLAGIIYTFAGMGNTTFPPSEFWKVISPVITTLIGFFVGAAGRSKE